MKPLVVYYCHSGNNEKTRTRAAGQQEKIAGWYIAIQKKGGD